MSEHTHSSRAKSGMGGKKSKSKSGRKPKEMHVRRGKSGGFIVKHIHDAEEPGGMSPEPEEHVLPDIQALQSHMADNMGDQGPAQASAAPPPDQGQAGPAAPQQGM